MQEFIESISIYYELKRKVIAMKNCKFKSAGGKVYCCYSMARM